MIFFIVDQIAEIEFILFELKKNEFHYEKK